MTNFIRWFLVSPEAWADRYVWFVFSCSILSNFLPPIEVFADFPRFQKYYVLFVNLTHHYGALNFRGKMIAEYMKPEGKDKP